MSALETPRRSRLDLQTPAEAAIRHAIDAVEAAGCDPRLTDAVNLLVSAREKVADFVDGTGGAAAEQPPTRHPSIEAVLQFFTWSHLPLHLQAVSRPFGDLALQIAIANTTSNAETTVALRKLLEAKDAAVRAVLFKDPGMIKAGDGPNGASIVITGGTLGPGSVVR